MTATRSETRFLIIVLLVIASVRRSTCKDVEVYFPMSFVELQIPTNEKSQSIFSKMPIGRFQVLSSHNNNIARDYIYSLENNEHEYLQINSSTGEVYIGASFPQLDSPSSFVITARRKGLTIAEETHMTLDLVPTTNEDFCKSTENLCYWSAVRYVAMEHNDYESFKPLRMGSLNPTGAKYLCLYKNVSYTLLDNEKYLQIKNNMLYIKSAIDRETLDSDEFGNLTTHVRCTVSDGAAANETLEFVRALKITVVDRNDNTPMPQDKDVIYNFTLEDPHFKANDKIGGKILFIDKDTVETNAHLTYQLRGDANDLVRPDCNIHEVDHTGRLHSVISCQILFSRSGILTVTPYCFSLMVNDAKADVKEPQDAESLVCIRTDVSKIHDADRPDALQQHGAQRNRKRLNAADASMGSKGSTYGRRPLAVSSSYPKDVYVYRTAALYYRVTQPEPFLDLLHNRKLRFRIAEDPSGAFNVTSTAGIVYVRSSAALLTAAETIYFLNVTWLEHSFVINVHLVDGGPRNTTCDQKDKSPTRSCAQFKYRRQCERFCGLATNGGACEWRGSTSGFFGRNYASCVPNAKFCPDNVCDPLEELNTFICPQDCAATSDIIGPHSVNADRRGILSASGTCICEQNGRCLCAPFDGEEPRQKRQRKNETMAQQSQQTKQMEAVVAVERRKERQTLVKPTKAAVCGEVCTIIVITCSGMFSIATVSLLFMCRRNRLLRKAKRHKKLISLRSETANSVNSCDGSSNVMPLKVLNSFKFEGCDSKWEVDRNKLVLDAELGEGEFGKVVKGYASDIPGYSGVTTVAVKMPKEGARFMDLLSEFRLLQEVSHPNVIKLLGACTQAEAPMIIIEYACHGSLRSYLRSSRKIGCAGVDGVEPVTAADILSFAWQICKGMAYLTDIKLVHRDLAARNVLLAEGKVCKISDFGLTRDVYEDDAYLKRSRDRVPVKWMAPESLADHVYTAKTDVWAFGVLCWELITLGASPYPGIPPQNLYHLLKSGYRMECPENCSDLIYSIVSTCWTSDPNSRPSFKYLASQFEKLLGKDTNSDLNAVSNPLYYRKHAIGVNGPEDLDHLWTSPKISKGSPADQALKRERPVKFSSECAASHGYDMPRPLIEALHTEQIQRYENDLQCPIKLEKSACVEDAEHYSVPSKNRRRSYVEMQNTTSVADNLDGSDFEKPTSKNTFRFSSLFNPNEQDDSVV